MKLQLSCLYITVKQIKFPFKRKACKVCRVGYGIIGMVGYGVAWHGRGTEWHGRGIVWNGMVGVWYGVAW